GSETLEARMPGIRAPKNPTPEQAWTGWRRGPLFAYLAALAALAAIPLHLYWVLGGTWGLPGGAATADLPGIHATNLAVSVLLTCGALFLIGLTRPWARRPPAVLMLAPVWAGGVHLARPVRYRCQGPVGGGRACCGQLARAWADGRAEEPRGPARPRHLRALVPRPGSTAGASRLRVRAYRGRGPPMDALAARSGRADLRVRPRPRRLASHLRGVLRRPAGCTRPRSHSRFSSRARATASVRFAAPSLPRTWPTCFLTVSRVTTSSSAMA